MFFHEYKDEKTGRKSPSPYMISRSLKMIIAYDKMTIVIPLS